MEQQCFYRLGKRLHQFRWLVILLWLVIIIACTPFLPKLMTPFKTTPFNDVHSTSAKTQIKLDHLFGNSDNRLMLLYYSKAWRANDPRYQQEINASVENLEDYPLKHFIVLPKDNKKQISEDKHTAYTVVIIDKEAPLTQAELDQFTRLVKQPAHLEMQLGGAPIFTAGVNKQTATDLYRADFIATPVSLITLLLVFGSCVAAIVPLILGGGCAVIILTALYWFAHFFSLSVYTINIAMLLGLCLSLDYALFIINRFRNELAHGLSLVDAIATTQATAGKAIFFSGLTVFVSLSALLFFPVNILFSVGVGGLFAVFVAVLTAIILLPAVLSVLHTKINWLPLNLFRIAPDGRAPFWRHLAEHVVNRPKFYFFTMIIFLLCLGYPFLHARFGIADYKILPPHSQTRAFFDSYSEAFNDNDLNPIALVLENKNVRILSNGSIDTLYDLTSQLQDNPHINSINSIVTTDPRLTQTQYAMLYNQPRAHQPQSIKTLLATTTTKHLTVINLVSNHSANAPQTKMLIADLKKIKLKGHWTTALTGVPVINVEVLHTIARILPYAMIWIMVLTYITLFFLLRSLFLPLKAIIMNILSLTASYGMLVFVIQEGHLHQLLNFQPQGTIDISLLIIIFCALFGFSMDYEVFLLSRIKEAHEKLHHNKQSIIFGIEHSSRIITSAAIIVIFICCSFMVADVLMVKAFGLGIAVAIFVDAFFIRTLLVPATMTLTKRINWYLPRWLGSRKK